MESLGCTSLASAVRPSGSACSRPRSHEAGTSGTRVVDLLKDRWGRGLGLGGRSKELYEQHL